MMKRGMNLMLGLGVFFVSGQNVFSEEGVFSQKGLGFTAGALSGIGLAYRQHFQNRWGFQIGGGAWGDHDGFEYHTGLEALRTIERTNLTRFYGLGGVGLEGSREGYEGYWSDTTNVPHYYSSRRNSTVLYLGTGIGIEFTEPKKGISLAVELPYIYMRESSRSWYWEDGQEVDMSPWDTWRDWKIVPIPSVNLLYYFR